VAHFKYHQERPLSVLGVKPNSKKKEGVRGILSPAFLHPKSARAFALPLFVLPTSGRGGFTLADGAALERGHSPGLKA
jgi:hypothetical protein